MVRPREVLQAAPRDAATLARLLAEALDTLADAVDVPEASLRPAALPQASAAPEASPGPAAPLEAPVVGGDKLWKVADVANFVGASESWVRHAAAGGKLPCMRLGGLLRFQPDAIRAYARGQAPSPARVLPRAAHKHSNGKNPGRAPIRDGEH